VANLGQIAGGAIQQHAQQKEVKAQEEMEAQRGEALAQLMGSDLWETDPQTAFGETIRLVGPDKAGALIRARQAVQTVQQQADPNIALKHLPAIAEGFLASGPGGRQRFYPFLRQTLMASQMPGADQLSEQWDEAQLPEVERIAQGWAPEEEGKIVQTVDEQGRPVMRRATGEELAQGVPVYQEPEKSLAEQARERFLLSKAGAEGTAAGKPPEEEMIGVDWAKTGEDFLATLPPELQATVQQLGEYRRRPSASLYRSESGRRLLAMVSQYNPEYDEKLYGEGQKAIGEFTSGATHRNIIAINTLSHHLVPFAEAASALDNNDTQALNKLKNYFSRELGSEVPTNFEALRHLVSDEIANTFKTTGATDSTIKNAADTVYAAQSPGQLLGALKRLARLAEGRIRAIGNKYDVTFGQGAFDKKGYISDEARHAYEMIGGAAGLGDIGEGETAAGLEAIADALAGLGLSQEDLAAALEEP
jgi:hypothetical protein